MDGAIYPKRKELRSTALRGRCRLFAMWVSAGRFCQKLVLGFFTLTRWSLTSSVRIRKVHASNDVPVQSPPSLWTTGLADDAYLHTEPQTMQIAVALCVQPSQYLR